MGIPQVDPMVDLQSIVDVVVTSCSTLSLKTKTRKKKASKDSVRIEDA